MRAYLPMTMAMILGLGTFILLIPCGLYSWAFILAFINLPVKKPEELVLLSSIYWVITLSIITVSDVVAFKLSRSNRYVVIALALVELMIAGVYFMMNSSAWYNRYY